MIKVSLDRQTKIESGCVPRLECAHSPCVCELFFFFTMQYNSVCRYNTGIFLCVSSVFFASASISMHLQVCFCMNALVCLYERLHHRETDRGVTTQLEGLAPRQHFCSSAKDSCTLCPSVSTILMEGKGEGEREEEGKDECAV